MNTKKKTRRETNNLHSFEFSALIHWILTRFGRNTQIKQVNYYENIFSRKLNNILNRFAFSSESFFEHSRNVYIVWLWLWKDGTHTHTHTEIKIHITHTDRDNNEGSARIYIWFVLLQMHSIFNSIWKCPCLCSCRAHSICS